MILFSFCLASPIFVKTELLPLEDLFLASSDQVGHISQNSINLKPPRFNQNVAYNWNQLSGISPHLANNLTSIHVCVEVSENHTLSIWLGLGLSPFSIWLSKIVEICFLTTALRLSPLKNIALMFCLTSPWNELKQVLFCLFPRFGALRRRDWQKMIEFGALHPPSNII